MKPEFRAALTMAAAGTFLFVAGVAIIGHHRTSGGASALTGAMLLAVAFPRLWSALPGIPTGRIEPAIEAPARTARPTSSSAGPRVPLLVDEPAEAPPPDIPPGIDPDTGELIPDNLELARRLERIGAVVAEQSELFAAALAKKADRG